MRGNSYVKNKVKIIIELQKTKNIFKICESYKIFVLLLDLKKNEKGSVLLRDGKCFVGINRNLSKEEKTDILIHEFAHFILHQEKKEKAQI